MLRAGTERRAASSDTTATAPASARYQLGASRLPLTSIRKVAMNGAVPPKSALAVLKLNANPVNRTSVGNSSAR